MFEVENKYPVADLAGIRQRLVALGAEFSAPIEQIDRGRTLARNRAIFSADRGASGKPTTLFGAMLAGNAALFVLGFVWLLLMAGQAQWLDQSNVVASAFAKAVQPFILWDILKMAFAALTVSGIWAQLKKR